MKLLSNSFNVKPNVVKISVANTLSHEIAKLIKVYELIKDGKQVVTEAIFVGGGRADIFNLDDMQVFEILHSEKEAEALKKKDKYPQEVEIFLLFADEVIKDGN